MITHYVFTAHIDKYLNFEILGRKIITQPAGIDRTDMCANWEFFALTDACLNTKYVFP